MREQMDIRDTESMQDDAKAYILRAGAFEQEGSSIDEYAVLIEGLRAHYDNYELYYMLGLYYRYRNADQAYLCFENALCYCDEPEDEPVIRQALEGMKDRARVKNTSVAFAEALEIVPKTLAENAGLDSIDSLVDLRAAHETSAVMGLDVFTGEVADMKEAGVIEPKRVKKQAIQSASEAAEMILRIDDVIASTKTPEDMAGGMDPAAMGGMPPMM